MQERKTEIGANTLRLIFLLVSAAAGIIFGAVVSAGGELSASAAQYVSAARSTEPLWSIAGTSFRGVAILISACFLLGFSAVSQPAEAVMPGISAACALSVAAREAMRMSEAVFRRTFLPDEYTPADALLYIKKFIIILVIGAAASAADGVFAVLLSALGD